MSGKGLYVTVFNGKVHYAIVRPSYIFHFRFNLLLPVNAPGIYVFHFKGGEGGGEGRVGDGNRGRQRCLEA